MYHVPEIAKYLPLLFNARLKYETHGCPDNGNNFGHKWETINVLHGKILIPTRLMNINRH